jgi:hypothetical protein
MHVAARLRPLLHPLLQPSEPSAIDPIAEPRSVPTILTIASVAAFRSQKSFDSRSSPRRDARFVLSQLHVDCVIAGSRRGGRDARQTVARRRSFRLSSDRFS